MKIGPETNAVVIGGGSGIGRGTALGLASRGSRLVIADIEIDTAEDVAAELVSAGTEALAARVDATDPDSLAALADGAEERFGSIDVLSNNVGVVHDVARDAIGVSCLCPGLVDSNRLHILTHPEAKAVDRRARRGTGERLRVLCRRCGGGSVTDMIDVDHQDRALVADRHANYAELRATCPVVFNEHHGGFWMVTDYHGICGIPRPPRTPRMGCRRSTVPNMSTSDGCSTRTWSPRRSRPSGTGSSTSRRGSSMS